jgi:RHS repeat-associated protein
LVAKYLYDPYGNGLSASGPLANANVYQFSSKEYNQNSGLIYYLYRFYDPNLQKWVSRDPLGDFAFMKQAQVRPSLYLRIGELKAGPDLYEFNENDAIDNGDLFGLEFMPPLGHKPHINSFTCQKDDNSESFNYTYIGNPPSQQCAQDCCESAGQVYNIFPLLGYINFANCLHRCSQCPPAGPIPPRPPIIPPRFGGR